MDSLDHVQLAAVLAHENAHIAGHHHQLLMILRGLATSLPRLPLFRACADKVAELLEMCADDTVEGRENPLGVVGEAYGAMLELLVGLARSRGADEIAGRQLALPTAQQAVVIGLLRGVIELFPVSRTPLM